MQTFKEFKTLCNEEINWVMVTGTYSDERPEKAYSVRVCFKKGSYEDKQDRFINIDNILTEDMIQHFGNLYS